MDVADCVEKVLMDATLGNGLPLQIHIAVTSAFMFGKEMDPRATVKRARIFDERLKCARDGAA